MTLQDPDRRPSSTARWRGIISAGKVPLVNDSDSWKEIALRWKLSASWPTPSTTISANKHLIFSTFPRPGGKTGISSSWRSEEHTSELQSRSDLVCRLLLEKKKYIRSSRSRPNRHARSHAQQPVIPAAHAPRARRELSSYAPPLRRLPPEP